MIPTMVRLLYEYRLQKLTLSLIEDEDRIQKVMEDAGLVEMSDDECTLSSKRKNS